MLVVDVDVDVGAPVEVESRLTERVNAASKSSKSSIHLSGVNEYKKLADSISRTYLVGTCPINVVNVLSLILK